MKPLDIRFGKDAVQSCNKSMASLAQGALATAVVIASCDLMVLSLDTDVEKAKPLDHGPTYEELDKAVVKHAAEMRGWTLFSAVAKQAPTDKVEMPASQLMPPAWTALAIRRQRRTL